MIKKTGAQNNFSQYKSLTFSEHKLSINGSVNSLNSHFNRKKKTAFFLIILLRKTKQSCFNYKAKPYILEVSNMSR